MADPPSSSHPRIDHPVATTLDALPDRSELAIIAVERTRMPMTITDPRLPDNPIVLANQAFLDLTGYGADEVIGRNCRFLQGPDTDPADVDRIRRGLEERRDVDVELLNYRKDGSTFWNRLSLSPVFGHDGALLYVFGFQIDVTEQRRARDLEAMQRLLLREVDHRTMNTLAVVESILKQTRADSVPAYLSTVRGRIASLARSHRLLAAGGWSSADLGEVVRAETAAFSERPVSLEGPALDLPATMVQPVATVIYELVTNALLHGALAEAQGSLQIAWRRDGETDHLVLEWGERGARLGSTPPTPGFGLMMITGIVERQFGGRALLRWPPDGLQAVLSFPTQRAA